MGVLRSRARRARRRDAERDGVVEERGPRHREGLAVRVLGAAFLAAIEGHRGASSIRARPGAARGLPSTPTTTYPLR